MTLHPGVRRGHHRPTGARFGPDTGHDLPLPGAFTDALRPLLDRYGTHPNLTLVLSIIIGSGLLTGLGYWQLKTRWMRPPEPVILDPSPRVPQLPTTR